MTLIRFRSESNGCIRTTILSASSLPASIPRFAAVAAIAASTGSTDDRLAVRLSNQFVGGQQARAEELVDRLAPAILRSDLGFERARIETGRLIRFSVIVPVLSAQMTVAEPSVSTASSRFAIAPRSAIRWTPSASAMVSTAGRPSGTAATASETPIRMLSASDSP